MYFNCLPKNYRWKLAQAKSGTKHLCIKRIMYFLHLTRQNNNKSPFKSPFNTAVKSRIHLPALDNLFHLKRSFFFFFLQVVHKVFCVHIFQLLHPTGVILRADATSEFLISVYKQLIFLYKYFFMNQGNVSQNVEL